MNNEDRLTGLALLDNNIDKVNILDLIAQDIEYSCNLEVCSYYV